MLFPSLLIQAPPKDLEGMGEFAAFLSGGIGLVFGIIVLVIAVVAWWKIFSKAGHSGALALLFFVPIVNLIIFLWFAFSEWPIHRRMRELERRAKGEEF